MDKLLIRGGRRLQGEVAISGAKNAALPELCAALLTSEPVTLSNVPSLQDVNTTLKLLRNMGAKAERSEARPEVVAMHGAVLKAKAAAEKLAELTLADFPYTHDVLSAKDNGDKRAFKVTVEDGEGLTAEGTDEVGIQLPQSGVEKCIFEDPEAGTVTSMIAAVTFTSTAIVAVGARDTGGGLRDRKSVV